MADSWGTYGKVTFYLVVIGALASIGLYLYFTAYVLVYSWASFPQALKELYLPFLSITKNILASIAISISVLVVFSFLLFIGFGPLGRMSPPAEKYSYSVYLVALTSIMFIVSLITSMLYSPPESSATIVLNFEQQISVATLTFILQIVPITLLSLFFAVKDRKGMRNVLSGNARFSGTSFAAILAVSTAFDLVMLYLIMFLYPGGLSTYDIAIEYVQTFFIFGLSNVIYLKFGFWKAYLGNFLFSSIAVMDYAAANNYALSLVLTIFIFAWILIGFVAISTITTSRYVRRREKEIKERIERAEALTGSEERAAPADQTVVHTNEMVAGKTALWVRGGCPSCGNPTFHTDSSATLTCLKCGREITAEEKHPHNIMISNGKIIVAMRNENNDDLYS